MRPLYCRTLAFIGRSGLVRRMNGTDELRLHPECRVLGETYEPEVWAEAMKCVKTGDAVIDVGGHWGLYAVAFGLRVGQSGHVLVAEPDPANLHLLRANIELNCLSQVVEVVPAGMSDESGEGFIVSGSLESKVRQEGDTSISLRKIDEVCGERVYSLMMIDVEGFEEKVLRGARVLLSDEKRRPRMMVVEVHPYAWGPPGTTSESLLKELSMHGYRVCDLHGEPVAGISRYGHVVATLS
ncbi:FkbM family methyltransferase [Brevifollis gellanilyticus]|nr:FkbM family methyltransferase [Brevifollis gellanilyticus]